MYLTFSPALNEVTRLVDSGREDQPAPAQDLVFKVIFDSRASLEQAEKDGMRVEMWTDLPMEGRAAWEWDAVPFRAIEASRARSDFGGFSLSSPEQAAYAGEDALYAQLPVRLHEYASGHQFSFTYRLVYPSGEIRWLGEFGRNGVFIVDRKPSQSVTGVSLSQDWSVGLSGMLEHKGAYAVGKLDDELDWANWALPMGDSRPVFSSTAEAKWSSTIICFPRSRAHKVIVPQPFILSAAAGARVRIDAEGKIITEGGNLMLIPSESLSLANPNCNGLQFVHGMVNGGLRYLAVAYPQPDGYSSVPVLLIPLGHGQDYQDVCIQRKALASFLPEHLRDHFVLNSSDSFYDASEEYLNLRVSPLGGLMMMSPTYSLDAHGGGCEGKWNITFLSDSANVAMTKGEEDFSRRLLPTPPPSPPPILRMDIQRPLSIPPPSFAAVTEQLISSPVSRAAFISSPTAPMIPPVGPKQAYETDPHQYSVTRVPSSAASRVYLQVLIAMFASLWQVLLQRLAVFWIALGSGSFTPSRSLVDMVRGEHGELTEVSDVGRDGPHGSSDAQPDDVQDYTEDTTICVDDISPEVVKADPDDTVEVPSPRPAATYAHVKQETEDEPPQPPSGIAPFPYLLSADVYSSNEKVSILVQSPDAAASPSMLKFSLDGQAVLEPVISTLNNPKLYHVDLATLSGSAISKLTITMA